MTEKQRARPKKVNADTIVWRPVSMDNGELVLDYDPLELEFVFKANIDVIRGHLSGSNCWVFTPEETQKYAIDAEPTELTYHLNQSPATWFFFPLIAERILILAHKDRRRLFTFGWDENQPMTNSLKRTLVPFAHDAAWHHVFLHQGCSSIMMPFFILDLIEQLFFYVSLYDGVPSDNFAGMHRTVAQRFTQPDQVINFRLCNAKMSHINDHKKRVSGTCAKLSLVLGVILYNLAFGFLFFFYINNLYAALTFLALSFVSLLPKLFGSCRYYNHENPKEKKNYYEVPPTKIKIRKIPRSRITKRANLCDKQSPIWLTANSPMYDEDAESIKKTFASYDDIYQKCSFIEATFLVDKIAPTMETILGHLTNGANLVRKGHLAYFPGNTEIQMRLLQDQRVLFSGEWPNLPGRKWTVVWKPNGGGKRNSQLQFCALMEYKLISRPRDAVLFVDADTEFGYRALMRLYHGMMKKARCGVVCGDVRIRNNVNFLTYAQVYEYMVSHLLPKAAESWFNVVLCSPGAWCMYRIEALEDVVGHYSEHPKNIREYHRLEQGEDRFLNTLTLAKGWEGRMIKSSVADTSCPVSLRRLMEQRRRWNNSTLENNFTAFTLGFLWKSAPFYMIALVIDTFGYLMYPAIFITLFGNTMAIALPLVTGWAVEYVLWVSYGIMIVFMFVEIFVFLLPIPSKKLVGFFRFTVFFLSVVVICIGVFVVLPFVLPDSVKKAPVKLPGITGPEDLLPQKRDQSFSLQSQPVSRSKKKPKDPWRDAVNFFNLGMLRIILVFSLLFYALIIFFSGYRFRGWRACWISLVGGLIFVFMSPTFYFTILLFSITRYDSTSWR